MYKYQILLIVLTIVTIVVVYRWNHSVIETNKCKPCNKSNDKPTDLIETFKKDNKVIFFHIPRTSGTTIAYYLVDMLKNYKKITNENLTLDNYAEYDCIYVEKFDRMRSPFSMIYEDTNKKILKTMIMVISLKEPIALKISEFYYYIGFRNKANYKTNFQDTFELTTFRQYCENPRSHNSQTKFILGHDIFSNESIDDRQFKYMMDYLADLNIFYFLEEYFDECIYLFEEMNEIENDDII